jgi:hypothetical protein
MLNNNFHHTDFNSCVNRGIELLKNFKFHLEEDGYEFNTNIKSCKWAIEQKITNRSNDSTMMSAVIEFVEMIEEREKEFNGI